LFRAAPPAPAPARAAPRDSALAARLRDVHPDDLTPIEALKMIYDLKQMATDDPG
jgi:DNA mismatch repair protein MutS